MKPTKETDHGFRRIWRERKKVLLPCLLSFNNRFPRLVGPLRRSRTVDPLAQCAKTESGNRARIHPLLELPQTTVYEICRKVRFSTEHQLPPAPSQRYIFHKNFLRSFLHQSVKIISNANAIPLKTNQAKKCVSSISGSHLLTLASEVPSSLVTTKESVLLSVRRL